METEFQRRKIEALIAALMDTAFGPEVSLPPNWQQRFDSKVTESEQGWHFRNLRVGRELALAKVAVGGAPVVPAKVQFQSEGLVTQPWGEGELVVVSRNWRFRCRVHDDGRVEFANEERK